MASRARVRVRVLNLDPVIRKLVTEEDMRATGKHVISEQAARIARGEGQYGRKMKRYSRAYREQLEKEGRPTDARTLRRSGHMLNSRGITFANKTRVKIGWTAKARYFFVHQKRTPFLKATKQEREDLSRFLDARVRERLKKNLADARANMRGL